jgi:hypothetical protein
MTRAHRLMGTAPGMLLAAAIPTATMAAGSSGTNGGATPASRHPAATAPTRAAGFQPFKPLGTLGKHFVGRASFSAITTTSAAIEASNGGSPVWVNEVGADYYWGSCNFASATVVRDPKQGGLWVVPMRVRLTNERNDWARATLSPASERTVGWALDG